MVLVLSLNPCIDLTLTVENFIVGGSHRATSVRRDPGGKAVNVARMLANLDVPCRVVGPDIPEHQRRTNVKIFDAVRREMTEVNQPGTPIPPEVLADLAGAVARSQARVLVMSGSLPPGTPPDVYRTTSEGFGGPVLLDTAGAALRDNLACATIIKPNLYELESTFGVTLPDAASRKAFCRRLLSEHVKLRAVCLSLGAEGALYVTAEGAWVAPPAAVVVRGVQGAGDAMVAGLALGLCENVPPATLLRYAAAAAAATLECEGTQPGEHANFRRWVHTVEVAEWN